MVQGRRRWLGCMGVALGAALGTLWAAGTTLAEEAGRGAPVGARCKVLDRVRISSPQGFRSPAAAPALQPLAYWVTRGGGGALFAGLLGSRGVQTPRRLGKGTFAELNVVADSRGYGLLYSDGVQGHLGRITKEGELSFRTTLDGLGGRFFRGSLTGTDTGYAVAWTPRGEQDSSPHVFAQVFDVYGRPQSPAVQMVNAAGYRFRDVAIAYHPERRELALIWGETAHGERQKSRIWFQRFWPPSQLEAPRPFAVRFGDDCAQGAARALARRDVVFVRSTGEAQLAYGAGHYGAAWSTRCDNTISAWFTVLRPDGVVAFLPMRLSSGDGTGSEPRVAFDGTAFDVVWEDRRGGQNRIAMARVGLDGQRSETLEIFAAPPSRRASRYPWGPSVAWDGTHLLVGYNGPDDSRYLSRVSCGP